MIEIKEKLDLSYSKPGKLKYNKDIFQKHKDKFDNISEFIYYYKNPEKAESERYCKVCGKKNKFVINEYQKYCSRTCMYKDEDRKKQIAQSNKNTFSDSQRHKEIIEQRKTTKLKKYGDENFNNPNKRAETNLERYGTDNLFKDVARMTQARKEKLGVEHALQRADLLKKSQDTLEKHYGVRATFKSQEIIDKKNKTNLEKWGTIYPTQNQEVKNKMAETNLKKWGFVSASLNPEIKKKQQDTLEKNYGVRVSPFASKEIQDKVKQINKQKYGEEVYRKSQDFKDKQIKALNTIGKDGLTGLERRVQKYKENCFDKYGVDNFTKTEQYQQMVQEVQKKRQQTLKEHGTFNASEPEEQVYKELVNKFGKQDIIRQYKNNEYPYNCDFYVVSLNLYIECHFSWTHGFEPFDSDNQQHLQKKQELEQLAQKSKYYSKTLYVWTDLDVRKLKCFKNNKLNYKIFYNKEQFNNWFKTI